MSRPGNSSIMPTFSCCSVWGNENTELVNIVIKFQKHVAQSILDKPIDTPSEELFTEVIWMTFPERVTYQTAILMYEG